MVAGVYSSWTGTPTLCYLVYMHILLVVSAVYFAPYLTGLSSMMLIQAAGARCK